jgi:hypothetical protein
MKKSIYITLALAGILSMNSCNDDEFPPGNPSMEIKAENADALFGDSLPFTIKASDVDVPLSTLKAQLFYGEEQVSETVIRTKTSGSDYTGKIYIPYYANIPNFKLPDSVISTRSLVVEMASPLNSPLSHLFMWKNLKSISLVFIVTPAVNVS